LAKETTKTDSDSFERFYYPDIEELSSISLFDVVKNFRELTRCFMFSQQRIFAQIQSESWRPGGRLFKKKEIEAVPTNKQKEESLMDLLKAVTKYLKRGGVAKLASKQLLFKKYFNVVIIGRCVSLLSSTY
jgi:hypothetical protein